MWCEELASFCNCILLLVLIVKCEYCFLEELLTHLAVTATLIHDICLVYIQLRLLPCSGVDHYVLNKW